MDLIHSELPVSSLNGMRFDAGARHLWNPFVKFRVFCGWYFLACRDEESELGGRQKNAEPEAPATLRRVALRATHAGRSPAVLFQEPEAPAT